MPTTDVSELKDSALDYAVYIRCDHTRSRAHVRRGRVEFFDGTPFNPSVNAALASVYIDEHILTLERTTLINGAKGWFARTTEGYVAEGPTYLVAALRAVVLTMNNGQNDVYTPGEINRNPQNG